MRNCGEAGERESRSQDHRVITALWLLGAGGKSVLGACRGFVRLGARRLWGSVQLYLCGLGGMWAKPNGENHKTAENSSRTVHTNWEALKGRLPQASSVDFHSDSL